MIRTASVPSDVADGGAVDLTSLEVHQSFCTFLYSLVGTRFSKGLSSWCDWKGAIWSERGI